MKKSLMVLTTSIALIAVLYAGAMPALAKEAGVAPAGNDFAFRLFARLQGSGEGNLFVCPFSISTALAMTWNGARGRTSSAMAGALGLGGASVDAVNAEYAALRESLEAADPQVKIAIANSLWAQRGVKLLPDFTLRCSKYYHAKAATVDFASSATLATINGWVKSGTAGKIREILGRSDVNRDTTLVLLNAVYFKGAWAKKFDPAKTVEGVFTLPGGGKKKMPMMEQKGRFRTMRGEGFRAVDFPYGNGRLSMTVFLPDEGSSLRELRKKLSAAALEKWISQLRSGAGRVRIPRFRIECAMELKEALTALGMGEAFRHGADFSAMVQGSTWLAKVKHKTFLEVNEEGSEAAGATAVVATRNGGGGFDFSVDRPFFLVIRDGKSGVVLFMGCISDPEPVGK